jgi:uncharacterized protein (TIGR00251 family)
MKSWLKNHEKGSLLLLHIQPGASKTELVGEHGDRLKVKIKAQPRDGEANAAVIDYFSEILKIPKKQIFLIRGESSRQKDLLVELSADKLIILLQELLKS